MGLWVGVERYGDTFPKAKAIFVPLLKTEEALLHKTVQLGNSFSLFLGTQLEDSVLRIVLGETGPEESMAKELGYAAVRLDELSYIGDEPLVSEVALRAWPTGQAGRVKLLVHREMSVSSSAGTMRKPIHTNTSQRSKEEGLGESAVAQLQLALVFLDWANKESAEGYEIRFKLGKTSRPKILNEKADVTFEVSTTHSFLLLELWRKASNALVGLTRLSIKRDCPSREVLVVRNLTDGRPVAWAKVVLSRQTDVRDQAVPAPLEESISLHEVDSKENIMAHAVDTLESTEVDESQPAAYEQTQTKRPVLAGAASSFEGVTSSLSPEAVKRRQYIFTLSLPEPCRLPGEEGANVTYKFPNILSEGKIILFTLTALIMVIV